MSNWIEKDDITRVCPACGQEFDKGCLYSVGDLCDGLPHYCPHCGRHVRGDSGNSGKQGGGTGGSYTPKGDYSVIDDLERGK